MIALLSVVPIIVTGISGALGVFILLISSTRKIDKVQISFGCTAIAVMLYGISTTELYNSSTLIEANLSQRMQIASIILFILSFFYFVIHYLNVAFWKKYFWVWIVLAILAISPQLFIFQPLVWNLRKSNFHLINFFGNMQIINESLPGIITQFTFGIGVISFFIITILVIQQFRGQKNKFRHPLFLSTMIIFIAIVNDTLMGVGIINSIYILEVGFLIVIGLVAFLLSRNILDAIATKEALESANLALQVHKEELEKTISERTHAFQYQAEYFRSLVINNPIATVTLDNNQRIQSVNPAFEELFGYSQNEALSQELDSLIAPEDQFCAAKALTEKALNSIRISDVGIRKQKDGGRVHVEILGVPVFVNNEKVGVLGLYRDISDQFKAEKILHESEMRYRSLFEDSPISLWEEDFSSIKIEIDRFKSMGVKNFQEFFSSNQDIVSQLMEKIKVINVNQATIKLFLAASKKDLIGNIQNIILPESVPTNGAIYASLAEGENQWIGEIHYKDFQGNNIYTVLRLSIAPGYEETWEKIFVSIIDITERKNNESFLEYLSTHDQLTGVANRSLLYDRLNHALAHAKRNQTKVAVFFLDLDGFKTINDMFGHMIGDQILIQIANRLSANIREADTVARFGGDEFILVLENIISIEAVKPITEKILNSIAEPYRSNGNLCQLTTSIGISIYPLDGTTTEELINKADTAMYRAKQLGKNQYKFFSLRS
ncbi:MAG: diguanylate cyclase [Anaerolineaceae bacterium]|nr:diguanylate cyclase [Anaerolineaceae bacterium]